MFRNFKRLYKSTKFYFTNYSVFKNLDTYYNIILERTPVGVFGGFNRGVPFHKLNPLLEGVILLNSKRCSNILFNILNATDSDSLNLVYNDLISSKDLLDNWLKFDRPPGEVVSNAILNYLSTYDTLIDEIEEKKLRIEGVKITNFKDLLIKEVETDHFKKLVFEHVSLRKYPNTDSRRPNNRGLSRLLFGLRKRGYIQFGDSPEERKLVADLFFSFLGIESTAEKKHQEFISPPFKVDEDCDEKWFKEIINKLKVKN